MQGGSAGWLRNQIRVAPSLLSALLHQLVPHLGPGHLKLHKEWFQPLPQITPIISDGGWELVKVASGFHHSFGDPAQPAEFWFVWAPLHTHLCFLTTSPVGFSTRPWNHSPRSPSERATTPGGRASLVPGWGPHTAIVCFMALFVGYAALSPFSASQSLSGLSGRVQVPPLLWSLPWYLLLQNLSSSTWCILPAVALLHISVSPCKFLEGRNNVSLMFVSPKQRSQCPMQKCSSINVCWLEVWFSLPYPLAFWALLGLSPWQYLKDNFTFWALCSCFICFYDVFIHSSCFMPEAKHFGDISVVRLNVWLFFFFPSEKVLTRCVKSFLVKSSHEKR